MRKDRVLALIVLTFCATALSVFDGSPALSQQRPGLLHALDAIGFAPVPKTGESDPYGDVGITWPVPRLVDNQNGTVTDRLTGLIWTKIADLGYTNWLDACNVCNGLRDGLVGLTDRSSAGDWRLPTVKELQSLIDFGQYSPALPAEHPFDYVFEGYYWSSTSHVPEPSTYAVGVDTTQGNTNAYLHKTDNRRVWCVKGGPSPKTQ